MVAVPIPPYTHMPPPTYTHHRVAVPIPGKWHVALDSDALEFGGKGRIGREVDHFSEPIPAGTSRDRDHSIRVLAPSRTVAAYYRSGGQGGCTTGQGGPDLPSLHPASPHPASTLPPSHLTPFTPPCPSPPCPAYAHRSGL